MNVVKKEEAIDLKKGSLVTEILGRGERAMAAEWHLRGGEVTSISCCGAMEPHPHPRFQVQFKTPSNRYCHGLSLSRSHSFAFPLVMCACDWCEEVRRDAGWIKG